MLQPFPARRRFAPQVFIPEAAVQALLPVAASPLKPEQDLRTRRRINRQPRLPQEERLHLEKTVPVLVYRTERQPPPTRSTPPIFSFALKKPEVLR